MPLYEYECDACAHRFEVIQKFSDAPRDTCDKCGGSVRKLPSSPAIQFKGSGWYITDYARAGKTDGAGAAKPDGGATTEGRSESSRESTTDSKGDSKGDSTGDSKSDTKSGAKSDAKGDAKSGSRSEPQPGAKGDSKVTASQS